MEKVEECLCDITRPGGYAAALDGLSVSACEESSCTCQFTVEARHEAPGGTLAAGVVGLLVDVMATLAVFAVRGTCGTSIDLNVTYESGASLGDNLTLVATVADKGNGLKFVEVTIEGDGGVVATGQVTKYAY